MWGRHSKRLKAEMPCQGMSFKWLVWLRCLGMAAGEWLNMSWHGEVCRYCSLEALSRESHWSGLGFGQGVQRSGVLSHCFLMQGSEAEHAIYITSLAKSQVIIIYVDLKIHMACTHHGSGEWCRHHCTVNECRCHLQHCSRWTWLEDKVGTLYSCYLQRCPSISLKITKNSPDFFSQFPLTVTGLFKDQHDNFDYATPNAIRLWLKHMWTKDWEVFFVCANGFCYYRSLRCFFFGVPQAFASIGRSSFCDNP